MDDFWEDKFWEDQEKWPIDTKDHIFLARAFELVGQKMFPSEWVSEPPRKPKDQSDEAEEAWFELLDEAGARGAEIRDVVADRFASWGRQGTLQTMLRPIVGGSLVEPPTNLWNFERARIRFERCEFSENDPFGSDDWSRRTHFIFVKMADLHQCLKQLTVAVEVLTPMEQGIVEAIDAIWSSDGLPPGISEEDRQRKIEAWYAGQGRTTPSLSTVRRAVRKRPRSKKPQSE